MLPEASRTTRTLRPVAASVGELTIATTASAAAELATVPRPVLRARPIIVFSSRKAILIRLARDQAGVVPLLGDGTTGRFDVAGALQDNRCILGGADDIPALAVED